MRGNRPFFLLSVLALLVSVMTGCTATTRTYTPEDTIHYDENYDFSDKKLIVETLVQSMLTHPPLEGRYDRPVLIVYGVSNRTKEHISTSGITDDIRMELVQSGKARLINETQRANIEKELNYQHGGSVSPEQRIERGRQAGALFMITGTLRSIEKKQPKQIRLKKKTLMYYSLNLELTDLKTGLIEWADHVEIVREASKPFIGW